MPRGCSSIWREFPNGCSPIPRARRLSNPCVISLLSDCGGGVLFLFQGEAEQRGIKFVMATNERWLGAGDEILHQVADVP